MKCIIREKEQPGNQSIGEPKEIIVDTTEWEKNGQHGHTYSYHMSKERFERSNSKRYDIFIDRDSEPPEGAEREAKLGTMGYYEFVDFDYLKFFGEHVIENTAKQLQVSSEEILETIREPLTQLQQTIRQEFAESEEFKAKKEHEEVIQRYEKAKRDFSMQFGFSGVDYDRCYNVFGQLMDAEYYSKLQKILHDREQMKNESRRFRKEESQKRFHEYLHASTNVDYTEKEQMILVKFYKMLAKKFHPDANPQKDTSSEMTLLNKLKRQWHI